MLTYLKKTTRGFTLIELLVVIAIIGVLASIVLASLNNARKKSRDARRITDIKQLQLALELSFDANKDYPDTLASLATGGYISSIPTDPLAAYGAYAYDNLDDSAGGACAVADAGNCLSYHLGARLEDKDNSALDQDADKQPAATWGFDGFNATDCGADAAGAADTEICYDVVP